MKTKFYVAYGSNLNERQMMRRCPDAQPYGEGTINGMRLMYKGSRTGAYLTIVNAPGYITPVGIWEVSESDEAALDRYEGYPGFYDKRTLVFTSKDGRKLEAFVYVMHEHFKPGLPSDFYVNTCRIGYRDFGFDTRVLDEALAYTKEEFRNEARQRTY